MVNLENYFVRSTDTLRSAIGKIESNGSQIVLVVSTSHQLLGTLSDGDVRRGIISGLSLDAAVELFMCSSPHFAKVTDSREYVISIMREHCLRHIPIVDDYHRVVSIKLLDELILPAQRDNYVVIMAGGLGSRLGDLTKQIPKPMLVVGERPLLETILFTFIEQGFRNFFFSVNYLANIIEQHFEDGKKFGVNIQYLREKERLGTAGSLSLLPLTPLEPFIVANGDVLSKIEYNKFLDSHISSGVDVTIGVSDYSIQIPFGVIQETNEYITSIIEKPNHRVMVNAGVYALSPQTLSYISPGQFVDMPSLIEKVLKGGGKAKAYNIEGYWLDIGHLSDYQKANSDIDDIFTKEKGFQ